MKNAIPVHSSTGSVITLSRLQNVVVACILYFCPGLRPLITKLDFVIVYSEYFLSSTYNVKLSFPPIVCKIVPCIIDVLVSILFTVTSGLCGTE